MMLMLQVQVFLMQRRGSFQHECHNTCPQMLLRGKHQHADQPQGRSKSVTFFMTKVNVDFETQCTPSMQTLGDLEGKAEEGNTLLEKQDLVSAHKVQFSTQGTI